MNFFSAILRTLALLICAVALAGCVASRASRNTSVNTAVVVSPMDIDRLTGAPWAGTLTYLDYTSRAQTSIRSSLLMTRLPEQSDGNAAWEMRVGYANEPHANSAETAVLVRGGSVFREGQVMERSVLPDGTIRVVTEQDGEDDGRNARFRFVYLLGEKQCSIQKLVRFKTEEIFFERHIYRWSR